MSDSRWFHQHDPYFPFFNPTVTVSKTKTKNNTLIEIGTHSGAVIHHQLQSITFVSLRTRNTRNKRLKNPVPPIVMDLLDSDMLLSPSLYYTTKLENGK
jgi:hypothetical protein